MRAQRQESEPPCEGCKFYARASARGLKPFADGNNYFVTGRCTNPNSPLNGLDLSGSMNASTNAVHHKKLTITQHAVCFVAP